uniref:Alkylated DNA repair protein AlkB homologue 8 N-terminal domain-containing protein n=1 Tax=Knipowitschia caucasica TaxID=637954 RepID=A0AAV2KZ14_KNICA
MYPPSNTGISMSYALILVLLPNVLWWTTSVCRVKVLLSGQIHQPVVEFALGYRSPSRDMLQYTPSRLLELNNHRYQLDTGILKHLGILRRPRYVHRGSGRWLKRQKSSGNTVPAVWSETRFVAARTRHQNAVTMETTSAAPALQWTRRKQNPGVDFTVLRPLPRMARLQNTKVELFNVQSLSNKACLIYDHIVEKDIDIMCLTETWQKPDVFSALNESCPPGYAYAERARTTGRGGGLAILHHSALKLTPIPLPNLTTFECLGLKVGTFKTPSADSIPESDLEINIEKACNMGQVEEAAEDLPEEPTQDQEASETEEQYDDWSRPGSPLEEDPVPVPSRSPVPGPSTPAAAAPTPTPIGKRRRPQPRAEPTAVEQAILFALKERPVPPPTATREFSHIEYYLLSLAPSLERLSFYDLEKTVEMIVDFRKSTVPPPPPSVMDSPITSVESFRFLGTTITQDLKWEPTISSLIKKAQQRMYFLRQLRKAKLPAQMLVQFYTAIIESILTSSITVWFAGATVRDKQRLQRIVRSAEEVIGRSLPSLQDLGLRASIQERSADIDTRSYTHHFYFGSFNQGTNNQDSKKEKD